MMRDFSTAWLAQCAKLRVVEALSRLAQALLRPPFLNMSMRVRTRLGLVAAVAGWGAAVLVGTGQRPLTPSAMRNHPSIGYTTVPPKDAVARLNERLQRGEAMLAFDASTGGYLRGVLAALDVPIDSQLFVFSKTSFQARKINPQNPRALYFNDSVSVGFVRGGEVLEFVGQDPTQGAMFYTLENTQNGTPQFKRDLSCVQCHTWEATLDVPGMFLGSVYPAPDGSVMYAPAFNTDHRTPFGIRWGGWYVTGHHPIERHMANGVVPAGRELADMITPESLRVESLDGRFDFAAYPSHHSDIVAIMVLEHQARMLNLMTRLGWEARLGAEAGRPLSEAVGELVDYLLFIDEEALPGPITGVSTFAKTFPERGPRDSKGRSLRELDMRTRMMRYPCSFLIYSEQFEALPPNVKRDVYARMWEILSGGEAQPRYARLSADDRRNIIEILRDTKPDLPEYFDGAQSTSP